MPPSLIQFREGDGAIAAGVLEVGPRSVSGGLRRDQPG